MAKKKWDANGKDGFNPGTFNYDIEQLRIATEALRRQMQLEQEQRALRGNERIEIIGPADPPIEYNVPPVDGGLNQWIRQDPPRRDYNYYQRLYPFNADDLIPRPQIRGQRVGRHAPVRDNERAVPVRNEVQQPRQAPPDAERPVRRYDGLRGDYVMVHEVAGGQLRHQDWRNLGPMGLRYRQQEVDPGGEPPGRPGPVQPDGVGDGV